MKQGRFPAPLGRAPMFGVRLEESGTRLGVACSPDLRTYRILGAEGDELGTLYGVVLSCGNEGLRVEGDTIQVEGEVVGPEAFETEVVDRIRGTFVIRTQGSLPRRLYPDTGGTIPLVYCPRTKRVGSSAGILLDPAEYEARLVHDRVERLIRKEGMGSWIPGTLTAHDGVKRLLSNHYLDLDSWTAVRFWPRREDFSQDLDLDVAAGIVARDLSAFMRAVADEFKVGISLTAGYDTRILLAAAREVVHRVEFFTTAPEIRGIDQIMAKEIAGALGLAHRTVPLLPASDSDTAAWDHAVGHAVLEGNRTSGPTLRGLDYDLILTGMFGEPGRSRLYRHDYATINSKRLTPEAVLSRLSRPRDPEIVAEVARWMEGLDWLPPSAVLDLAHMELKSGGWAMAQHAAQCAAKLEMNPIAQRSIRRAFLSVLPEEKGTEALFRRSIALMWPELLDFPVNRFGNYRDALSKASKLFQPGRLRRHLRARLS
jgi:hypothetical protein